LVNIGVFIKLNLLISQNLVYTKLNINIVKGNSLILSLRK